MRPLDDTLQLRALLARSPERGRLRISAALAKGGSVERGARELGVPLRTFYRLLYELGMREPKSAGAERRSRLD